MESEPIGGEHVISEEALLESESLRASMVSRTEVLDRVKRLRSTDASGWATTAMVAEYFGVGETVIRALAHDHRDELTADGYRTLTVRN